MLSIDIDSRTSAVEQGLGRLSALQTLLLAAPSVVKQFDSTLRGHIAEECYAAMRLSGRTSLIVLSAFPSLGRSTLGGVQRLHGRPVHETEFSRDPLNPVHCSSLLELFQRVSGSVVSTRGMLDTARAVEKAEIVIVDAEEEEELDVVVRGLFGRPGCVWAGSTGLLRCIARTVFNSDAIVRTWSPPRATKPLVVIGSRHAVSRRQLSKLRARTEIVVDPAGTSMATLHRGDGRDAIVVMTPDESRDPRQTANAIAQTVEQLISGGVVDGVVATGGETVKAILEAIKATRIDVVSEIEPGVPYCMVHTSTGCIPFVTKAGGFGSDQLFERALEILNGGAGNDWR